MAKVVEAEERDKITGLLLEYFRQIRQKGGYPYDANRLTAFLQEGIEGRFWSGLFDDVLYRHKLSRAELYQIICMNGSNFFEAINEIVDASSIYSVLVNYDRSVEEGIRAGHYDWSNSNITSSNFPSTRKGAVGENIHLVHFNKVMSTDAVLAELDKMGLRPAELQHSLAFGEKYPEVQREFPVIFLGSVWRSPNGDRHCPYLGRGGAGRWLGLRWLFRDWYEYSRFADVRK
jgi:hypothetical protein